MRRLLLALALLFCAAGTRAQGYVAISLGGGYANGNVTLQLLPPSAGAVTTLHTFLDLTGATAIRNLVPGTYGFWVSHTDGTAMLYAVVVVNNSPQDITASLLPIGGGSTGVTSFNSRTGAVVPTSGDYSFASLSGNISTSQMNSGTGASSSTFWRGDNTWATVAGSGTVTSVGLTAPSWLSVTGSPVTISGNLGLTPATSQTSHQVIGTCGSATTFGPCSLTASDIPTLNQNTSGSAASLSAQLACGAFPPLTGLVTTPGGSCATTVGNIPVTNLNSGTAASSATFWRGDGTWAGVGTGSLNTIVAGPFTANTGPTVILTPGANGFYRATGYIIETTGAGTSSSLPALLVQYTDADTSAATSVTVAVSGNTANVAGANSTNVAGFNASSAASIRYSTILYTSNPANAMAYKVYIKLEGPF